MAITNEWSQQPVFELDPETARRRQFQRLRLRWIDLNETLGDRVEPFGFIKLACALPGCTVERHGHTYCHHHLHIHGDAAVIQGCATEGCNELVYMLDHCSTHLVELMHARVVEREASMGLDRDRGWPSLERALPTVSADIHTALGDVPHLESLLELLTTFTKLTDAYWDEEFGWEHADSVAALLLGEISEAFPVEEFEPVEELREGLLRHFFETRVGTLEWSAAAW